MICIQFIAATLPSPLQWEGRTIWRVDLKAYQFSNGQAWLTMTHQDPTTGALVGGPFGARQLILNAASSGAATAWLPISPNPERLIYQLTSGSASTGFAVDISADGVTSLGQAFIGTWARSDLAFITGLISFSNPLARFFRVTVTSGGPISMARGA